jgi:hypothetical protein
MGGPPPVAGMGGGGARGSGGPMGGSAAAPAGPAAAADAAQSLYNALPSEYLVLDAREYDKQLMDPGSGQLQLLGALLQVDAWDAAELMLQWLQVGSQGACYCVCMWAVALKYK